MSSKASIMKSAQVEKTKQAIQLLIQWHNKKQDLFKLIVPLQQSLIKRLLAAPEISLNRLKEIGQIAAEQKQLQAIVFEKTQKGALADENKFLPPTQQKDPKNPKPPQQLPTWSNNIDRILLSMSRALKERRARVKLMYKTLDQIHGEILKQQGRYRAELKKQQKDLQKVMGRFDDFEKESSKVIARLVKESKGELKDAAFYIGQIKTMEKSVLGEFQCFAERNKLMAALIKLIIKNEKVVSKKIKEQLTNYLTYRRQNCGKQTKNEEQTWGFLAIVEERVEEERVKYFNTNLLNKERTQTLISLLPAAQFKNNWQLVVKFLQQSKIDLMKMVNAQEELSKILRTISYRCWNGVALAQGWLIESYTPAVIYMTYDFLMIIYNSEGQILKKITTSATKVKRVEGETVFLEQKVKGFFSDSIQQYKIRFEDMQRLQQFQLFIDNQLNPFISPQYLQIM